MKTLRGVWRFTRVLLYAFVCLYAALTKFQKVSAEDKGRMLRYYCVNILKLAGVACSYEGKIAESYHDCGLNTEPVGQIIVSNHVSWLDIFSLDSQNPARFIAKAEIANWPIFGSIASAIGTLFIDRSSRRAILRINDDIASALIQSQSVAVFAEGTTTFGNELLPIRANFLAPAVDCAAAVQPVIISYLENGKPTKKAAFAGDVSLFGSLWNVVCLDKAEVKVHFLEPITNTKEMTRQQIGELCQERMRSKLKEIWGEEFIENDPDALNKLNSAIANG